MRMSKQAMADNHQTILAAASRLFREKGIDRTSVADVMQAAGLTHGGFYRHFDSKEALVDAAVSAAFDEFLPWLAERSVKRGGRNAAAAFAARYLSDAHVDAPGSGCPIPTLGVDLARQEQQGRMSFDAGVGRLIDALAEGMPGTARQRRAAAARQLAMLAGAVVIARAVDEELAAEVLAACRQADANVKTK